MTTTLAEKYTTRTLRSGRTAIIDNRRRGAVVAVKDTAAEADDFIWDLYESEAEVWAEGAYERELDRWASEQEDIDRQNGGW